MTNETDRISTPCGFESREGEKPGGSSYQGKDMSEMTEKRGGHGKVYAGHTIVQWYAMVIQLSCNKRTQINIRLLVSLLLLLLVAALLRIHFAVAVESINRYCCTAVMQGTGRNK
jgi:hypothetical protein